MRAAHEKAPDLPLISVLLPAKRGFTSILPALATWAKQTAAPLIEVLILCPEGLGPSAAEAAQLGPRDKIIMTGDCDLHAMRALGLGQARGEFVILAEDHCVPDADCIAAIVERLRDGHDAVSPALRAGHRDSSWAKASFVLGYGEWMEPVASGPINVLCGHNATVRTSLMRAFGDDAAGQLRLCAFAVKRLREGGARFFLENRARMRHFDPPGGWSEIKLFLVVGLGFGAMRTQKWPWLLRLIYPLAAPVLAVAHWRRAAVHCRRVNRQPGFGSATLAAAAVLAAAWGVGEGVGALLGIDRVTPWLSITEVKPISWDSLLRSNSDEGQFSDGPAGTRDSNSA
jgi:hypothetical protein